MAKDTPVDYETIAKRLRSRRAWLGLKQEVVAQKLGTDPSYVSRLESGKCSISLAMLYAFAEVYKCSVADFLLPTGMSTDNYLIGQIDSMASKATRQQRKQILRHIEAVMGEYDTDQSDG